jgi:hypothetical protein
MNRRGFRRRCEEVVDMKVALNRRRKEDFGEKAAPSSCCVDFGGRAAL